jgi:hypothetical protein
MRPPTTAHQKFGVTVCKKRAHSPSILGRLTWDSSSQCVGYLLGQLSSDFLSRRKQRAVRHVDRAVQSVGITLRRNKPKGRAVENAHTFDR